MRILIACLVSPFVAWFAVIVLGHIDFSHENNAFAVTCVVDPTLTTEHALERGRNASAGPWGGDVDVESDPLGGTRIHVEVIQYTEDWHNVELWITGRGDGATQVKAHVDFAESSGGCVGSFGGLTGTVRVNRSLAAPSLEPLVIEYELQGKQHFTMRTEKGKIVL